MYLLLSQIFISVIGANLPEEAFNVIFPLLEGGRKDRKKITLGIKDYSRMTPHQILVCDIPENFYQNWEQYKKLRKKIKSELFRKTYYLDAEGKMREPVHLSNEIWIDRRNENPIVRLNMILYMNTKKDKEIVLRKINKSNEIRGIDISWVSSCVFCENFMRESSYKLKSEKNDIEVICKNINRCGFDYGENFVSRKRRYLTIPICSLCRGSKDRQNEYRMNMLSRGDWGTSLYHERSEEYHREIGNMYPKPDMSEIPEKDEINVITPYDCSPNYWDLTDPFSDYFWHPELSADEYMRYVEHKYLQFINVNDPDPLDDDLYDQFEASDKYVVEDVMEYIIQKIESNDS